VPAASDMFDFLLPGAPPDHFGGAQRWHGVRETPNGNSDFDPKRGPLAEYLQDARVQECPEFFEYKRRGEVSGAFESGTGGYGYNMAYVGSTQFQTEDMLAAVRAGILDTRIQRPGQTVLFADSALPQAGHLIEYGFIEPPHPVSAQHPQGDPNAGWMLAPSIHFRHYGRANVLWADGHITSEKWGWSPVSNVFGGNNRQWGVGWFGPENNQLFDSGDKSGY
jgi:prepilin-type processing-associated H-X9-DG protein